MENVMGKSLHTSSYALYREHGVCSYYGEEIPPGTAFTASGELFNYNHMTAAHKTLPFGSVIRVTNIRTKEAVVVRINDRGPHIEGRIVDLSYAASKQLSMYTDGVVGCSAEIMFLGDGPIPEEFKRGHHHHHAHSPMGMPVHEKSGKMPSSPLGRLIGTEVERHSHQHIRTEIETHKHRHNGSEMDRHEHMKFTSHMDHVSISKRKWKGRRVARNRGSIERGMEQMK